MIYFFLTKFHKIVHYQVIFILLAIAIFLLNIIFTKKIQFLEKNDKGYYYILLILYCTCKFAYFYNPNVNGFDYMLIRCISMIVSASIPVIWYKVNVFQINKEFRLKLTWMMILIWISIPSLFYALRYLSTFKVNLILNLVPIIFFWYQNYAI